jgi:NitT/TauT family transport system substrate-binding protein
MLPVLEKGDVDAIAVVEPFLSRSKEKDYSKILGNYFVSSKDSVWVTSYCASKAWLDKNKILAEKFSRAMDRAIQYCQTNEKSAREILLKYTKLDKELAFQITLPIFSSEIPPLKEIKYLSTSMVKHKWINDDSNLNEILYK